MRNNLIFFVGKIIGLVFLFFIKFLDSKQYSFLKDRDITTVVNSLIFLLILSIMLQVGIQAYRRRKQIPFNRSDNLIAGINNAFILVALFVSFFVILKIVGVSVVQFFTSISIVAAAIVLLTKEYLSDLISGFMISFSDILSIGDYVSFSGTKGEVRDITLTKTHILTQDEEMLIMPNSKIFFSEIINYTKGNRRRMAINFNLALSNLDSVNTLEKALIKELKEYSEYIEPNSFLLRIEEIEKDSIEFKFLYTINRVDAKLESAIRKKTVRKIVDFIKQQSVNNTNVEKIEEKN